MLASRKTKKKEEEMRIYAAAQAAVATIFLLGSMACAGKPVVTEDKFLAQSSRAALSLDKSFFYCRRDAAFADHNAYQCERKECDIATTNCSGNYAKTPQEFSSRDFLQSTMKGIFKSAPRAEEKNKKFIDDCLAANFFACVDAAGFFMEDGNRNNLRQITNYLCGFSNVKCTAGGEVLAGDKKLSEGKKLTTIPDENFLVEIAAREGMRSLAVYFKAP